MQSSKCKMQNLLLVLMVSLAIGGLFLTLNTFAQEATPPAEVLEEPIYTPRLLPDNPLYFLKRIKERIELFFAFTPEKRAEKLAEIATRRIAEAKMMVKKGKPEFVERLMARYQKHLERAIEKTEEAKKKGKEVEKVLEIITQATSQHQGVLSEVYEKVPEEAKKAIEKAIEVSGRGQEEALKAVSGEKREEMKEKIKEKMEKRPKVKEVLEEKVPEVLEKIEKPEKPKNQKSLGEDK